MHQVYRDGSGLGLGAFEHGPADENLPIARLGWLLAPLCDGQFHGERRRRKQRDHLGKRQDRFDRVEIVVVLAQHNLVALR
jgi:hypothetical protein